MRFELRDAGGATEFWAFDVHPRFDKAMAGLRWEPVDDAWRRSLACPVQAAEAAFANMTRLLLPVLRQTADMEPIPWQDALAEVCRRFAADELDWWLGGSAALAVRGAKVGPHGLDLIIAEADSLRAGELLFDGIIEQVVSAEWSLSRWWGRAFLHARVEWAGGVTAAADQPDVTDFGPAAACALETVKWRDWQVRVPPLHLQRAVSERRELAGRIALIDELIAAQSAGA